MLIPSFKAINNRDAWSSIRGFVYQVDYTISRWLSLEETQVLELEKGEDIDQIGRDVRCGDVRTLEQLKHRESTISLNQELTLEILKNFYLHKANNPNLKLFFRFVTNASYTIERPALFIDARKGIDVWERLSKLDAIDPADKDLQVIKKFLLKKIGERIIPNATKVTIEERQKSDLWLGFSQELENDYYLIDFIKCFEWSTENLGHIEVTNNILKLLKWKYPDKPEQMVYERLFLYVFKLLCSPGEKLLDQDQLNVQCEIPEITAQDQELLKTLNVMSETLRSKLQLLKGEIDVNTTNITQLYEAVEQLKTDATFDFRINNLSFNPPDLILNGTAREQKVQEMLQLFVQHNWIAFQGINGTGKTQLASLVCRKFNNCVWLDMREMAFDGFKAPVLIETFLMYCTNQPLLQDRNYWLEKVMNTLPPGTIIILNDLPHAIGDYPALQQLLINLGNASAGKLIKILTTSNYKLPAAILNAVQPHTVKEYYEFNFTDDEINECLLKNNVNPSFLKLGRFIAAKSQRNPRIVLEMIYQLKSLNWDEEQEQFFVSILGSDFSTDLIADAQRSIIRYIKNDKTRELLYRLSLISWDFSFKEVKAISEVSEVITHPNEHLSSLTNIWIQQLSNQQLQMSPIIKNIGLNNLSDSVIKQVHLAFASSLVTKRKVNQVTATRAILSFVRGGDHDGAGNLLFNFYRSAINEDEIKILDTWGYLNYWSDVPLPPEMDISLRTFIKLEQLRLNTALARNTAKIFEAIDDLIQHNDFPLENGIIVRVLIILQYQEISLATYWEYLNFVLKNWSKFQYKDDLAIDLPSFSILLCIPLSKIVDETDIIQWINMVDLLKNNTGYNIFDNEITETGVTILCTRIVTLNPTGLEKEELFKSRISRLKILLNYFHHLNQEIFEAIALREIIHIKFLMVEDLNEVKISIEAGLIRFKQVASKFLITAYLGKFYYRNNEHTEARVWLNKALSYNCEQHIEYGETLIYAAAVYSAWDPKKSILYCERAIHATKSKELFNPFEYLQILGELGVAYWLDGNTYKTFETYELLVNEVYQAKGKHVDANWIKVFLLTGHNTGYMSSMVTKGVPPQLEGGEEFFKPFQGMFTFDQRDLTERYQPNNDAMVAAQMAFFADGLNMPIKAYQWSLKAFDLARNGKNDASILMIASTCSQYAIINFKPEEAFESYLLFAAVSSHLEGNYMSKYLRLQNIELTELLKVRPSEKWKRAEATTVEVAVIPLLIQVLNAYLENAHYKQEWKERFIYLINNYMPDASDQLLWDLVLELADKILNRSINITHLRNRANAFGEHNNKALQIICILGIVFVTKDNVEILTSMINIVPYLQKLFGATESVNKFVIIPFVRNRIMHIINEEFVGDKTQLQEIIDRIATVDVGDSHAIQKIIQPAVDMSELKIPDNRQRWLYNYEII